MTQDEFRQLVEDIRTKGIETDSIEVKSARCGTPKRLQETLSAFANHTGGGVLVFGLDEMKDFALVGVGDPHRLQEELTHLASDNMEPALRPEFFVDEVEGKPLVAAVINEVPPNQKPCYYKKGGLNSGSYIRSGNTNRRMTPYEVFGYVSAREQPTFDEKPVADAGIDDLEPDAVEKYLAERRRARPNAKYLQGDAEKALLRLRVLRRTDDGPRPSMAGLLMFGKYPQEFFPQWRVTFVQYYGTTEEEKTPKGERFVDNRVFEGAIPEMIDEAEAYILSAMRKASLIDGVFRREIPEYPPEALREALANAVAHRDYSEMVKGSQTRVRMFADRMEIQSPGGLYGNVNEDNIDEEQSTRNILLMRLMEDCHIVENRGSGISAMLQALREANLEPPRFTDRRSSFRVTFRNYTLMGPDAIKWLNQFAGVPLNDRQRLALVYLRQNDRLTNSDYRRLNHVGPLAAGAELREIVRANLVEQHGVGGGTFYRLAKQLGAAEHTQAGTKSALSRHQVEILRKCQEESTLLEMMALSGRTDRTKFRHQVLAPLLDDGLVEMTIPDKPRSSKQKYRLTGEGRKVLEADNR